MYFKILIGAGRAGKTTYGKLLEKQGYEYIALDDIFQYCDKEEGYESFIKVVADKVNKNPNKNFVLDGYCIYYDNHFSKIKEQIKHHTIIPVVIYSDFKVIKERIEKTKEANEIKKDYEMLIRKFYKTRLIYECDVTELEFVDMTNEPKGISYKELIDKIITPKDVIEVMKNNVDRPHSPHYQTIEMPFNFVIGGNNMNHEHISWDRIKPLYDFRNKKVIDLGCQNGFFSFKVKESGARLVHAVDKSKESVNTAMEIAMVKGLPIKFWVMELISEEFKEKYDCALLLNVIHHFKEPIKMCEKVFKICNTLILEIMINQTKVEYSIIDKDELCKAADEHGFMLKHDVDSVRDGRRILLFERIEKCD